jgi:ribosomal protein S19
MRSSWKVPYIASIFFGNQYKKKTTFLSKRRNSLIPLKFSKQKVVLHNGAWFKKLPLITRSITRHRMGEFIPTRLSVKYTHIKKLRKTRTKKK